MALLLSLVFGGLSYRLVETPSRRWLNKLHPIKSSAVIGMAVVLIATAGWYVKKEEGASGRLSSELEQVFDGQNNLNRRFGECGYSRDEPTLDCLYGGPKLGAIVLGDSHAQSVVRSVEKSLGDSDLHVLDWTLSSRVSILGVQSTEPSGDKCGNYVKTTFEAQKQLPADVPLIIVNRVSRYVWGLESKESAERDEPDYFITHPYEERSETYLEEMSAGITQTACAFARYRPVYMLRPTPELSQSVPKSMGWSMVKGNSDYRVSITREHYAERHRLAIAAQDKAARECGVNLLDPLPYLCDDQHCYGDKDGQPIYFDSDHLSERGGELLIPLFSTVFSAQDPASTP